MTARVCIYNLDYHTSENELTEYLEIYPQVKDVFIPNHSVSYGYRRKPLGVAYASFETPEEAGGFAKDLEGKVFKGRKLKTKIHVPYTPKSKPSSSKSSKGSEIEDESQKATEVEQPKEYSTDTIHVKGLKGKVNDALLYEFFKDFNPTSVKLMQIKWKNNLKVPLFYTALVTLDLPDGATLDTAIEALNGHKCGMGTVKLTKAFAKEKSMNSALHETTASEEAVAAKNVPAESTEESKNEDVTHADLESPALDPEVSLLELKSGELDTPELIAPPTEPEPETKSLDPERAVCNV